MPDRSVVCELATFLEKRLCALAVQPRILEFDTSVIHGQFATRLREIVCKVFMLSYRVRNRLAVRRSGTSVLTRDLTKVIPAQRLHGCCCYRRDVFREFAFDTNLKRWSYLEDLDFSYRIYKKYKGSLYVTPAASLFHKRSSEARLTNELETYMRTTHWFYVFFKDVFEYSMLNLVAFLWAVVGNVITVAGKLLVEREGPQQWWQLIFLLRSHIWAFRHLQLILRADLGFLDHMMEAANQPTSDCDHGTP
jgi:GT2 family glycosyltransferase